MGLPRRQFLLGTLAMGGLAALSRPSGAALALGPAQRMTALRIRHGGGFDVNPGALDALLEETRLRTSTDTTEMERTVSPLDTQLYDSMFAVVAGQGPFTFTDEERQRLGRWLGLGGFLLFDNAGRTAPDKAFDQSARAEMKKILPEAPLERVSPEHVIYRTFYRLDYPAGRAIHQSYVEGARLGSRLAVVLNSNDLLGALARSPDKRYLETPVPGGESQREMAMRFGVNLLMYAACLHYKDDQVHIDFLLHKRKWKIEPPR